MVTMELNEKMYWHAFLIVLTQKYNDIGQTIKDKTLLFSHSINSLFLKNVTNQLNMNTVPE